MSKTIRISKYLDQNQNIEEEDHFDKSLKRLKTVGDNLKTKEIKKSKFFF